MKFVPLASIVAATLLLSSCLLTPGRFTSTLDVKRDRSFTFTYVGEVIHQLPDETVTSSASSEGEDGQEEEAPKPKGPKIETEEQKAKRHRRDLVEGAGLSLRPVSG